MDEGEVVVEEFRISSTTHKNVMEEANSAAADLADEYCEINQIPKTEVRWSMAPDPQRAEYLVTLYRRKG